MLLVWNHTLRSTGLSTGSQAWLHIEIPNNVKQQGKNYLPDHTPGHFPTSSSQIRALLFEKVFHRIWMISQVGEPQRLKGGKRLETCLSRQRRTKKKKKEELLWLVDWLRGLSVSLWTKGSLVWLPVRAHAWVAGQVPSEGPVIGNHTLMFLSLFFSLPPHLSKNK